MGRSASHQRRSKPPLEPPRAATWLQGARATRLYFSASPPAGEPWGVLHFVPGPEVGAAEPYPGFTAALHAAGLATTVLHARGSGFSDGVRGDVEDGGLILDDLHRGLERARATFPGRPIFLFGHSAGAALALEVAARSEAPLAGLILVNPAYRLSAAEGMRPSLADVVRFAFDTLFRRSALTADMNGNPAAIEHAADREEALRMRRDPLVVRFFSMRFLLGQRAVMKACPRNAAAVHAPLLLVQGAGDALVDPRGSDEILAAAGTADKVKLVAARGGHGASAVETIVEALLAWLRARRPSRGP